MSSVNETHDPALRSWIESANQPGSDFPLQNLPYGVFRRRDTAEAFRGGVAIGDMVIDLGAVSRLCILADEAANAVERCAQPTLNAFMAMGPHAQSALRLALSRALREGAAQRTALAECLIPQADVELAVPAAIGDYTDFYASVHHATTVGRLFRPDNPLLPNYKWVPIGYHGRSSTIVVSGQTVARPIGQTMPPGAERPQFGPAKRLDYELEMGIFVGPGNAIGTRIPIGEAEAHVFGLCLLNDWSARDIQAWEYQPLGPFLSKSFATTISPWIVTLEALAPFRVAWTRPRGDPDPLPYLDSARTRECGAIDIQIEALLRTARMRASGAPAAKLSRSTFKHAYWTIGQMVTHHSSNGCSLRAGDLFGSGTASGPGAEEAGSLLELSKGGKEAIELPGGERRTFIEDGDTVIFRAWCEMPGAARIGFGECRGTVMPAI